MKNKLLLQKNYHLQESSIDSWPYWLWEQNIIEVNEMTEEEEKQRKSEEKSQKESIPNYNMNSYMNNMKSVMNKFGK